MPNGGPLALRLSDVVARHRKRLAEQRFDPESLISPARWRSLSKKATISGSYRANAEIGDGEGFVSPKFEWNVKVDVDGWYPQSWISIHIRSIFGYVASAIFKLNLISAPTPTSIRLEAALIHSFGNQDLLTFDGLMLEAEQGPFGLYDGFVITFSQQGFFDRALHLERLGTHFESLSIEMDNLLVLPASEFRAPVATTLNTKEHEGNLPSLAKEVLTIPKIFGRAGFKTTVSINPNAEIVDLAGDDKLWSDSELHNAMVNYWSQNAALPQWSLWTIFADTHEAGRDTLGMMFDYLDDNQRQGCAVFLDSYIANLPLEDFVKHIDPLPTARRRVFFTLVHELGHALNLGHSFEKTDGTPWLEMANDPLALSFMNYPEKPTGSAKDFFAKFGWRFVDDELKFMRHAPRQFVQPGYADWNENHGATTAVNDRGSHFQLKIAPHQQRRHLEFMEPLWLDISLTNGGARPINVDKNCLDPSNGLLIRVKRSGGPSKIMKPAAHRCTIPEIETISKGGSLRRIQFTSADASGWLIAEPGLYEIQAFSEIGGQPIVSNTLTIYVAAPTLQDTERLAPDYFTRDVGALLTFDGAPALGRANAILEEIVGALPQSNVAVAAAIARLAPELSRYKTVSFGARGLTVRAKTPDMSERSRQLLLRVIAERRDSSRLPKRLRSPRMSAQLERLL